MVHLMFRKSREDFASTHSGEHFLPAKGHILKILLDENATTSDRLTMSLFFSVALDLCTPLFVCSSNKCLTSSNNVCY